MDVVDLGLQPGDLSASSQSHRKSPTRARTSSLKSASGCAIIFLMEKARQASRPSAFAPYGGYRKTFSFGLVCLIYHATTTFCRRNFNFKNDPLGKTVGQMTGAARSARQNIVEASSRAGTSSGTETRLMDVAKASLQELAGDYESFLMDAGKAPWSESSDMSRSFQALRLDPFNPGDGDVRHAFGQYLLSMRRRFAPFLEAEDPETAANCILLAIDRASAFLRRQMEHNVAGFADKGGSWEHMGKTRIAANAARDFQKADCVVDSAPKCPKCGTTMKKRVAKKGRNAGNAFWSCPNWPECDGTRPC